MRINELDYNMPNLVWRRTVFAYSSICQLNKWISEFFLVRQFPSSLISLGWAPNSRPEAWLERGPFRPATRGRPRPRGQDGRSVRRRRQGRPGAAAGAGGGGPIRPGATGFICGTRSTTKKSTRTALPTPARKARDRRVDRHPQRTATGPGARQLLAVRRVARRLLTCRCTRTTLTRCPRADGGDSSSHGRHNREWRVGGPGTSRHEGPRGPGDGALQIPLVDQRGCSSDREILARLLRPLSCLVVGTRGANAAPKCALPAAASLAVGTRRRILLPVPPSVRAVEAPFAHLWTGHEQRPGIACDAAIRAQTVRKARPSQNDVAGAQVSRPVAAGAAAIFDQGAGQDQRSARPWMVVQNAFLVGPQHLMKKEVDRRIVPSKAPTQHIGCSRIADDLVVRSRWGQQAAMQISSEQGRGDLHRCDHSTVEELSG
jgi:hypothetical protein